MGERCGQGGSGVGEVRGLMGVISQCPLLNPQLLAIYSREDNLCVSDYFCFIWLLTAVYSFVLVVWNEYQHQRNRIVVLTFGHCLALGISSMEIYHHIIIMFSMPFYCWRGGGGDIDY